MTKYNVDTILRHAMDIEEVGQKFYAMLSEKVADPELKKIFTLMSRQETVHKEIFSKMREQLPPSSVDKSMDAEQFDLNAHELIADKIFNRMEIVRKTQNIYTLGDALALMIDIEISGVDYYENFRKLVRLQDQAIMERVINEEKTHVRRLVDLRTQYKATRLKH